MVLEREGRKDAVRSEPSIVFGVPAGYAGGWYGCIHVSHCGCVHVGHGQQKVRCKYGWDGHVTSARRESDCLDCLCKVGSLHGGECLGRKALRGFAILVVVARGV